MRMLPATGSLCGGRRGSDQMKEKKIRCLRKRVVMRLTGAGVVVYAVHDREIYVLLGRERETPGWRQGSHKWSAFSGKVESHESALQGAAREFTEEACACVPVGNLRTPTCAEDVETVLRLHARPVEQSMRSRGERLVYFTYILRVDYHPYERTFARTREQLMQLDSVFRGFYRAKKLAESVPRFFFPGFAVSARITVVSFHVTGTSVELLMHEDGLSEEPLNATYVVDEETARVLVTLEDMWKGVLEFIREREGDDIFVHPAVNIVFSGKEVVNAYVNKAYVEKCEIGWWRLSDLLRRQSERETGASSESEFRRLFLDNVVVLAKHIAQIEQQRESESPFAPDARREDAQL